ncbi:DUF397 domain-containing protein [Actinokineospora auranticolor]|uniref:Uncharacterized protein DUF397 n=1 Tax=Actinokineospora auranticolor TaxID=155976 RepID=A0A2S6GHP4_9PSEU|nr:DUF397 domain-containing protein [Actinokineospora auranticolor]PPK64737.1 uncharacterized protein DUF397 [Actinokineospora auranticolor]
MQTTTRFRKSSRSGATSDCVEIGHTLRTVRDSKRPDVELHADIRALLDYLRSA